MTGGGEGSEARKVGQGVVGRSGKASSRRWHLSRGLSQVSCEEGRASAS